MAFRKLEMDELGRLDAQAFAHADKFPLVLVADNVRSALNVGSLFRTSDAFALRELVLAGITAIPPNRDIAKTALGADLTVPFRHFQSEEEAIKTLKNEGYKVLGIEQTTGSVSLETVVWSGEPVALVLGNEAQGISETVLPHLDGTIEIPQFGTKHSLNVSVAAGIVLWHFIHRALTK